MFYREEQIERLSEVGFHSDFLAEASLKARRSADDGRVAIIRRLLLQSLRATEYVGGVAAHIRAVKEVCCGS